MNTREVTSKGSKTLFYYAKERLKDAYIKNKLPIKVRNNHLGAILVKDATFISNWKRGKYRFRAVEDYANLSDALDNSMDLLFKIASEEVFPHECEKYKTAINKKRVRKIS